MSLERGSALAAGIIFGTCLCFIIFKFANKDSKVKTEYDERQEMIRGKSYQYAFYTICIYEALIVCLGFSGLDKLPVEPYVYHILGVLLGATVLGVHSIKNGAYWGINNNRSRYIRIFVILFMCNLIPVAGTLKGGVKMVDGYLEFPFLNLFCVIFMAILAGALVIFGRSDSGAEEE